MGRKAAKNSGGGWVTLIISANDTLTVARSAGGRCLHQALLSKADSMCAELARPAEGAPKKLPQPV